MSTEAYYVLKRCFAEEVDVLAAVKERFGEDAIMQDIPPVYEGIDNNENNVAVTSAQHDDVLVFHNSWGDSLESTTKVKVYLRTQPARTFDDDQAKFEWQNGVGDNLSEWLTEATGVGWPDEPDE